MVVSLADRAVVKDLTGKESLSNDSITSDKITSDLDRALLKHIRSVSDLIVTTGATFRAEKLKPSRFAPMLVLTSTALPDVDDSQAEDHFAVFARFGTDPVQVTREFMAEQGFSAAVIECGPRVTKLFAAQNALDQFCLTIRHGHQSLPTNDKVKSLLADLNFDSGETTLRHEDSTHSYWTALKKLNN